MSHVLCDVGNVCISLVVEVLLICWFVVLVHCIDPMIQNIILPQIGLAQVHCIGLLYWFHCIGSLYWVIVLVHCTESLYWFIVLVHCIGSLYWFIVLIPCIGSLYWFIVLVHCIGSLY